MCHGHGHVVSQCLSRNFLIEGDDLDDDEFKEIYKPVGSASDTDKDVRVSRIQLSVIRCLHATPRDEDWRRSSVFYTYVAHDGKSYKLMIDGESCVNIISMTAVEKMGLKVEPHNHTTLLGSTKPLNLLPNVVECLSKCLVIRIVYGVTLWIWTPHISSLVGHGCMI